VRSGIARCALLAAVAAATTSVAADPAAQAKALERGAAALKERRWSDAEAFFREALVHDEASVPAQVGLGEALLGANQVGDGLEALRRVVDDAPAHASLPAAVARDVERARETLKRRDVEGRRLRKLGDDLATTLARLAKRSQDADPDLARAATRHLARVRPDHPDRGPLEARLDLLEPGEPLFNGRDGTGWFGFEPPDWTVADGTIVARAKDVYAVTRTDVRVGGDFEVRAQVRVVEGRSAVLFLQGAWTESSENFSVGMYGSAVYAMEGNKMGVEADPPKGSPVPTKAPVDPARWNQLELRFTADRMVAAVNGEVVKSMPRTAAYASGHVALRVLQGTVAFRRIELLRR
jgi:hypothetical protein